MIYLDTLQILVDWFGRSDYGVNVVLASVPHDARIPDPPQVKEIKGFFADDDVAQGLPGLDTPVLAIRPGGIVRGEGAVAHGPNGKLDYEGVPIEIWYIRERGLDAHIAAAHGDLTLRAASKSVAKLDGNEFDDDRTRNGIYVVSVTSRFVEPVVEESQEFERMAVGALRLEVFVRDNLPLPD